MENSLKNFQVRQARKSDSKDIWRIRNSDKVRECSLNQSPIPFDVHDQWFKNQYFYLKDNFCFVLADPSDKVFGYCRFDKNPDHYLVSIAIDQEMCGRGLGSRLLKDSLPMIGREVEINATIKIGNEASMKLFLKNNFSVAGQDQEYFYLKYKS